MSGIEQPQQSPHLPRGVPDGGTRVSRIMQSLITARANFTRKATNKREISR